MRNRKLYAGLGGALLIGTLSLASVGANGAETTTPASAAPVDLKAKLHPLNNSGAHGRANVVVRGQRADVHIDAHRLAKGLPHAQHLHFGKEARHECPSVFDDTNNDHRLNVAEGVPAYGPILKSLTKSGDTSPDSALAVDRFPTTPNGDEHYDRRISFSEKSVARAIRHGKGVLVIHGVDYNSNGEYDFEGAGASEIDPSLPAEATDPALCGVLR
jgi:hypothetical protein